MAYRYASRRQIARRRAGLFSALARAALFSALLLALVAAGLGLLAKPGAPAATAALVFGFVALWAALAAVWLGCAAAHMRQLCGRG